MVIRESLDFTSKEKGMTEKQKKHFRGQSFCCICDESLVKDENFDPLYVWDGKKYEGIWHRKCFKNSKYKNKNMRSKNFEEKDEEPENCEKCKEKLRQKNYRDAFINRCPATGKYVGAAHDKCNKITYINPKTQQIPIVFHNLRGYDAHLLMQEMSKTEKKITCIPKNMENYIKISVGGLCFIDSANFLEKSLENLAGEIPSEKMRIIKSISKGSDLLLKKGIYPYEYMDCWGKFEETSLPEKKDFYSKLNDKSINDEEYEHAKKVWEEFGCKTMGDYHDLYVKRDVALLADIFENFRDLCENNYGLDPANYYTSPGLSWDALLKKTGVELDLLTDIDMHLFIERGMRGGISMVSKRYSKANNQYVADYDEEKPKKYLMYLDANNLYGWAMSKPLPKKDFKWKQKEPSEEEIMAKKENDKKGWILDVDLEYPVELHEKHNNYPLCPEIKKVEKEWMSDYQHRLLKNLELKTPKINKLLLTFHKKKNYVLHYRNLQFYLKQGMKLEKVNKVLEFEQESWMEPYIRMNTEFRKKAKSDFEKNFYKRMNNSVFGKTMENIRKRLDIELVRESEQDKIRKLIASPLFKRHTIFTKNMFGIEMRKTKLILNKPVYAGMTILDNSKILMYDFYYNQMKKDYGPKCELLYTDTDSLLLEIETEDFYKDMEKKLELYDTSDYSKDSSLYSETNKKVLGKMKDECNGKPIDEFVGLRSKMYSIKRADKKSMKKAKGVKKCVVKNKLIHEQYKETLFGSKELWHGMGIIKSEGHELFTLYINKKSLSSFDSKRNIDEDGFNTKAYGHYMLGLDLNEEQAEILMQMGCFGAGELEA